jgi:CBS domain-containing protein
MFNPVLAQMLTAYDMANTAPPIALADQPITEVLEVFHTHDVSSLPVIENEESRRLLGVIEQRDVLQALHVEEEGEEASGH